MRSSSVRIFVSMLMFCLLGGIFCSCDDDDEKDEHRDSIIKVQQLLPLSINRYTNKCSEYTDPNSKAKSRQKQTVGLDDQLFRMHVYSEFYDVQDLDCTTPVMNTIKLFSYIKAGTLELSNEPGVQAEKYKQSLISTIIGADSRRDSFVKEQIGFDEKIVDEFFGIIKQGEPATLNIDKVLEDLPPGARTIDKDKIINNYSIIKIEGDALYTDSSNKNDVFIEGTAAEQNSGITNTDRGYYIKWPRSLDRNKPYYKE